MLDRDASGYTQAVSAADIEGISEFMEEGGLLGNLWMEGHFGVGDPLGTTAGARGKKRRRR